MRILFFGASITYGAWDAEGGWVDRIKRDLHQDYVVGASKHQVFNLGVGGDTSAKILERLVVEAQNREWRDWVPALVFSFGTNDSRLIDGQPETPISRYETNVYDLIVEAKKLSKHIMFVGIPPLAQPTIKFKKEVYNDERMRMYADSTKRIVRGEGLSYVDTRSVFKKDLASLMFRDGLHPNTAGHALIAKAVRPELDRLIAE